MVHTAVLEFVQAWVELDDFSLSHENGPRRVFPWELLLALHDVLSRPSPLLLQGQLQMRSNLNSVPSTFKLPHSGWYGCWEGSTEGQLLLWAPEPCR